MKSPHKNVTVLGSLEFLVSMLYFKLALGGMPVHTEYC